MSVVINRRAVNWRRNESRGMICHFPEFLISSAKHLSPCFLLFCRAFRDRKKSLLRLRLFCVVGGVNKNRLFKLLRDCVFCVSRGRVGACRRLAWAWRGSAGDTRALKNLFPIRKQTRLEEKKIGLKEG
jgi:hypothetical protein